MREVAEEPAVMTAVDDAVEKWPRAGDAWEALVWVISHDPEAGTALSESGNVRALTFHGARSNGMPTIEVIYDCGDPTILLKWAEFSHAKAFAAGRA